LESRKVLFELNASENFFDEVDIPTKKRLCDDHGLLNAMDLMISNAHLNI